MIRLPRRPQTDDELYWLIVALWGIRLPRQTVCAGHISPFEAVAHAFFAREPNFAVWYASRGSGKSLALAVLGLTKAFVDEVDVTIIGGSMVQSLNVRNHMAALMDAPNAPRHALAKDLATLLQTTAGAKIEPLPASQKTVRGKHPVLQLLDEVDEMDLDIYDASLGQAMPQPSKNRSLVAGEQMVEYVVASSTWQNPEGTFSEVVDRARTAEMPVFTWCWRELLEEHGGWMSRRFIDNKRKTVSAQMWKTEYELNEPSGASRAFDLDKLDEYFVPYGTPIREKHNPDDDMWVWEEPEPTGVYGVGADWAKEQDKTVIPVVRYDVWPHRLVKLRIVNRRPWPVMIGWFNEDMRNYHAVGEHDKTGLGGVVHDFIATGDHAGFVMVGRKRTEMLLDYITEVEHGRYRLPREVDALFRGHRATTVADVYAPGKWDSHLPDVVAAMALANWAIKRAPGPAEVPLLRRDDSPRKVDQQFHLVPEPAQVQGVVSRRDDVEDGEVQLWVPTAAGGGGDWW